MRRHKGLYLPSSASSGGGTGGGGGSDLPGWTSIFYDDFATTIAEGAMFRVTGDHAEGLGAYTNWGAQTYLTTFGDQEGTGDYYGINNMSVVSGITGANGNCLQMRLYIDGSGKKVGCNPYPNTSGTYGASSASSAMLYGRCEARFMATSVAGWKTAWLWWPQTWAWTNEMDFPEGFLNGHIGGYVHKPGIPSTNAASYESGPSFTAWHTTALEWSPTGVKFILDGATVLSTATKPTESMFFQMQTENGLPGDPQPSASASIWIDYVAMWSWAG